MERVWASRLRWRLRGATLGPAFVAFVVADAVVLHYRPISGDRRAFAVQLTSKGKHAFDAMASTHEQWVIRLLAGLSVAERRSLYALLGRAKAAVRSVGEEKI